MNLENVFRSIAAEDPEFYERTAARRSVIRTFLKGTALTALPVALGGLLKKSYGQSGSSAIASILNFALTLEYLEEGFYRQAVANATAIGMPADAVTAFTTMRDQEYAHIRFLTDTITAMNEIPVTRPTFDYSGGSRAGGPGRGLGPYAAALTSNYDLFLALAQVFEDMGVRAYKGGVTGLISNNEVLTAALQIHSVEARHAAHIRMLRAGRSSSSNTGTIKPWITGNASNILTGNFDADVALRTSYQGEDALTQSGINLTAFGTTDAATEAFDEPLDRATVEYLLDAFIV